MEYTKTILKYIKYLKKLVILLLERKMIELEQEELLVGITDLFPYSALFKQELVPGFVYEVHESACTLGVL